MISIINAKIITPFRVIEKGYVSIENGRIVAVEESTDWPKTSSHHEIVDAQGLYLSPGFIDIHIHGGGGSDFMDNDIDAYLNIAETHARFGTTAMLPTTLTSEQDLLLETFEVYAKSLEKNEKGARFYGLHLEGPYFAMEQRGAQDPRYIRNPNPEEYEPILSKYKHLIARWSAAPELPGALTFGQRVCEEGILLALAHTDAVYDEVVKGVEAGYKLATHLYSGMSGMTRRNAYRYAGAIESCLLIDDIDVEIIADGTHLPEPFLKLITKVKAKNQIILITDAMRAAGTDVTESILGSKENGLAVVVEDGVAKLPDRKSFAGSVATADRLIRTMTKIAGLELKDAVHMLTVNPARILGLQHQIGAISKGLQADLILFDENIQVQKTMIEGRFVYEK